MLAVTGLAPGGVAWFAPLSESHSVCLSFPRGVVLSRYNLDSDPTETTNVATANEAKVQVRSALLSS